MNTTTGRGPFEVKMERQPAYDTAEGTSLGRSTFTKQFQGDLTGTSTGEMLGAMTETKGSAGYVALERISGTLHGRTGSFVVVHRGLLNRGASELMITIVPDSGTGELKGISGQMTIEIVEGKHYYSIAYSLTVGQ
jgi:hypothetical protein